MMRRLLVLALCGAGALAGCAREIDEGDPRPGDGGMDASVDGGGSSPFGNVDAGTSGVGASDAALAADAFFINDPQPPVCGPDGVPQMSMDPGGTAACPDDKNREGCPCPESGKTAACWPGKRINRAHGICKDGMTTCTANEEFGLRWGPCQGYVLPTPGALAGPEACRCFSAGRWAIDNIVPCIASKEANEGPYLLYSSHPTQTDELGCGSPTYPPAAPAGIWSKSSLNVDCSGQFKLCYAIKAGDVNAPKPDDCVVMRTCVDVWYPTAGVDQPLPDLPGWTSTDEACATRFVEQDGYGEMTVIGHSGECDKVDDGKGQPYVFFRTYYCKAPKEGEQQDPSCEVGGSGMFE